MRMSLDEFLAIEESRGKAKPMKPRKPPGISCRESAVHARMRKKVSARRIRVLFQWL